MLSARLARRRDTARCPNGTLHDSIGFDMLIIFKPSVSGPQHEFVFEDHPPPAPKFVIPLDHVQYVQVETL